MPRKRKRQLQGASVWKKIKHQNRSESEKVRDPNDALPQHDVNENHDEEETCPENCDCKRGNRTSTDNAMNCHHMVQDDEGWVPIEGNRMVDLNYLLRWMLSLFNQHSRECNLPNFCLIDEKFASMVSTIFLVCKTCNIMYKGKTENPENPGTLRKSIVWSVVTSGETHAHAEEFFALMGSPFMCFNTFMKTEHDMYDNVKAMAENSMQRAVEEEKEMTDEFDENGMPLAKIFLDGSWPKRSYGGKYASKSGAAIMIGSKTQKVIYGDTKNTFCIKCYFDAKNGEEHQHKCFKNFDGTAGAIEPAILVEGFNNIHRLGLKGRVVVGDGDSSVFDQLKNKCVYGEELVKANCKNHAIKNLKKHLHSIAGKNRNDVARSALRNNIERLCAGVHAAIIHCADEGGGDVDGLRHDIQNSLKHVFGCHDNCRSYFCDQPNNLEAFELINSDKSVYTAAQNLLDTLSAEADRLRYGESTNVAENFMSVIVKFIMGKRLNLCSRGAYSLRVYISILQFNEGYGWAKEAFAPFLGRTKHPPAYIKYVEQREGKRLLTSTLKRNGFQRGCTKESLREVDYSPERSAIETDADVVPRKKLEYEIDADMTANNASLLILSQISKGRILTTNISSIIKTRKVDKLNEKADICSSLSHNERIFRKMQSISHFSTNYMTNAYGQQFTGPCALVRKEYPFVCGIVSGVSSDGKMIFLTKTIELQRKKKTFSDLSTAAVELPNLGVRIQNGVPEADGTCIIESQCCMYMFGASKCVILFVNASNHDDNLSVSIEFDECFFSQKIQPDLLTFIDNYFVSTIIQKNISPRKCMNNK